MSRSRSHADMALITLSLIPDTGATSTSRCKGYSDDDNINTFKARAAHGGIIVNGTNALEMTLQAPAGSIDALILADMRLTTYYAEDTVIEYIGLGLFVDTLVVSEKRAILVRKTHIFVLSLYYSFY